MLELMRTLTHRGREADEGASAVEYGLLVAAIAALIVLVVFALGTLVRDTFRNTCNGIATGSGAAVPADCTAPAP